MLSRLIDIYPACHFIRISKSLENKIGIFVSKLTDKLQMKEDKYKGNSSIPLFEIHSID